MVLPVHEEHNGANPVSRYNIKVIVYYEYITLGVAGLGCINKSVINNAELIITFQKQPSKSLKSISLHYGMIGPI